MQEIRPAGHNTSTRVDNQAPGGISSDSSGRISIRDRASRREGRHTKPTPVYPAGPWCLRELTMLQDADGRRVGWLERMDAFDLVKTGQVTVLWSGAHPRYLQLEARRVANYDSGSVEKHTKYSHNHAVSETYIGDDGNLRHRHPLDVNPELVWTLKRLPDFTGPIFRAVLDSVISDYVYSPDERGNFHAATPEPPANDDRREHRDNVVCIRSVRPVGDPRRAGEVQKRAA